MRRAAKARRGSALIMALLIVLVLTVIGIGIAYLTQTEDAISGNARLNREAFYAAETGLRTGEKVLQDALNAQIGVTTLLNVSGTPAYALPGGGSCTPLNYPNKVYLDQVLPVSAGSTDASAYSLYVRNNIEDPNGSASDGDNIMNLVVVGWAVTVDSSTTPPTIVRRLATRILEEQFNLQAQGSGYEFQKGFGGGGTGGIRK